MANGRSFKGFEELAAKATTNEAEAKKSSNLKLVPCPCEIRDGMLVLGIPLALTPEMVNCYEEEQKDQRSGVTKTVDKMTIGIEWEMPGDLEFTIRDEATDQNITFAAKVGGPAKRRTMYIGLNPQGFIRRTPTAQAVETE